MSDKFRITAKKFFLTYPQCNLEKEDLLSFLKTKANIIRYHIGREKHEDGNLHLHAAVEYSRKLNIKDPNSFDYKEFHPNIQAARNYDDVAAYCTKDGDFITNSSFDDSKREGFYKRKRDSDAFEEYHQQKKEQKIVEEMYKDLVLYPWQEELLRKLQEPVKLRRIFWVWSEDSNTGKSSMRMICESKGLKVCIGKNNLSNLMYCYNREPIIWIDIPRNTNIKDYLDLLETVSTGGFILSEKYESKKKLVISHVVVSSNIDPIYVTGQLPDRIEEIKAIKP